MSKLKKILIFVATTLIVFLGSVAFANAQTNITQGGTGLSSYTTGDMLFFNSGLKFNKLGIGTAGQCLIVSAGLPAWGSCSAGSGDISAVGDVTSGDAFTGTQGTQLTFNNAGGDGIFSYDGTDFNFDKSISLGTAGVRLAGDGDGAITFTGLGNGSDEDLTLNLDDTANTGKYTSSTGLNRLIFDQISLSNENGGGSGQNFLLSHNGSSWFGGGSGGTGRVGFGGVTSPTAKIHIGAGATGASTAPLKFTAGTNMTTPEAGAVEFDGTSLFYTDSTPTRRTLTHTGNFKTINGNSILGSGDLSVGTIDGSGVANEISYWIDSNTLGSLTNIYLNGSDIETIDNNFAVVNKADQTKKVKFASGSITTATTRTKTFQDTDGTLAELGNKLSAFASTTSAELASVLTNETGTDKVVYSDTPTFTTRINVPDIRASGSGGFLLEASNGTDIGLLGASNTANVTWYGSHNFDALTANKVAVLGASKTLASDTGSDLTVSSGAVSVVSASTTTAGKVELAIDSEVNTGTSTSLAVTPDALAGSYAGSKELVVNVLERNYTVTTGDRKACVTIPSTMNGMNVVEVGANVYTTSTSGTPTIQIARGRQSSATSAHSFVDVLSTRITIDANEYDSKDATTAPVINTSNDDLATGDLLCGDIDVTGTGTKGLSFRVVARLP